MHFTQMLTKLLMDGNLGFVSIGTDLVDILNYLGTPDGYDGTASVFERNKLKTGRISFPLRYGLLEILVSYETHKVVFFSVDFSDFEDTSIPSKLDDGWIKVLNGLSRQQFKDLLINCELSSKRILYGSILDESLYQIRIFKSGIVVNFDIEGGEDRLLVVANSSEEIAGANPYLNSNCVDFN